MPHSSPGIPVLWIETGTPWALGLQEERCRGLAKTPTNRVAEIDKIDTLNIDKKEVESLSVQGLTDTLIICFFGGRTTPIMLKQVQPASYTATVLRTKREL